MASTTWTGVTGTIISESDNSVVIEVAISDSSDGHLVNVRRYIALGDGSKVIDERTGAIIATPVPAALISAASAFRAQIASLVTAGISGGKVFP